MKKTKRIKILIEKINKDIALISEDANSGSSVRLPLWFFVQTLTDGRPKHKTKLTEAGLRAWFHHNREALFGSTATSWSEDRCYREVLSAKVTVSLGGGGMSKTFNKWQDIGKSLSKEADLSSSIVSFKSGKAVNLNQMLTNIASTLVGEVDKRRPGNILTVGSDKTKDDKFKAPPPSPPPIETERDKDRKKTQGWKSRLVGRFKTEGSYKEGGGIQPNPLKYETGCLTTERGWETIGGLAVGRATGARLSKQAISYFLKDPAQAERARMNLFKDAPDVKVRSRPGGVFGWVFFGVFAGLAGTVGAGALARNAGYDFQTGIDRLDGTIEFFENLGKKWATSDCFWTYFVLATMIHRTSIKFVGPDAVKPFADASASAYYLAKGSFGKWIGNIWDGTRTFWTRTLEWNQGLIDKWAREDEEIAEFAKFLHLTRDDSPYRIFVREAATPAVPKQASNVVRVLKYKPGAKKPKPKKLDEKAWNEFLESLDDPVQKLNWERATKNLGNGKVEVSAIAIPTPQGGGWQIPGMTGGRKAVPAKPGRLIDKEQRLKEVLDFDEAGDMTLNLEGAGLKEGEELVAVGGPVGRREEIVIDLSKAKRGSKKSSEKMKQHIIDNIDSGNTEFSKQAIQTLKNIQKLVALSARGGRVTGGEVDQTIFQFIKQYSDNYCDLATSLNERLLLVQHKLAQEGASGAVARRLPGKPSGTLKKEPNLAGLAGKDVEEILNDCLLQIEMVRRMNQQTLDFVPAIGKIDPDGRGGLLKMVKQQKDAFFEGKSIGDPEFDMLAASKSVEENLMRATVEIIPDQALVNTSVPSQVIDTVMGKLRVTTEFLEKWGGDAEAYKKCIVLLAKVFGGIVVGGGKVAVVAAPVFLNKMMWELYAGEGHDLTSLFPKGFRIGNQRLHAEYSFGDMLHKLKSGDVVKNLDKQTKKDIKTLVDRFVSASRTKLEDHKGHKVKFPVSKLDISMINGKSTITKLYSSAVFVNFDRAKEGFFKFLAKRLVDLHWIPTMDQSDVDKAKPKVSAVTKAVRGGIPFGLDPGVGAIEDLVSNAESENVLTKEARIKENLVNMLAAYLSSQLLMAKRPLKNTAKPNLSASGDINMLMNALKSTEYTDEQKDRARKRLNFIIMSHYERFINRIDPESKISKISTDFHSEDNKTTTTLPSGEPIRVTPAVTTDLEENTFMDRQALKTLVHQVLNEASAIPMGYSTLSDPYPESGNMEDEPEKDIDSEFQSYMDLLTRSPSYDMSVEIAKRLVYERDTLEELLHLASSIPELKSEIVQKIFRDIKS